MAAITGRIATPRASLVPASSEVMSTVRSTRLVRVRRAIRLNRPSWLATIYHACGIDPEMNVYNHLNQPRELVKAKPVSALFA